MIAGYRVDGILGSGGMGHVFRANQVAMEREVALKVLSPEMTDDANALQRFLREARTAAKLDHANIVTAFDAGCEGNTYYLAMTFVDGSDLMSMIQKQGGLEEEFVLRTILRIAEALEYAWQRHKMLHRDIKPANIMIDSARHVKLMDMGISKIVGSQDGATDEEKSEQLRLTHGIVGTPYYMSPEQANTPGNIDFRADMYALGATAYHCMTGKRPFEGPNRMVVLTKHMTEPLTPPRQINHNISEATSSLVERMMAKTCDDRPSSWSVLIADLKALVGESMVLETSTTISLDAEPLAMPTIRTLPKIKSRVLIIDDDAMMLKLLRRVMPADFIVASASSGMEGIALIEQFRPDIILLDLHMSGINGFDVLNVLRKNEQHSFVRIIVVSGDDSDDTRMQAYEVGADDFISKPFRPDEVRMKLYRWARFTRYEELSQVKDEFLELVGDEEHSPFPATVKLLDTLAMVEGLGDIPEVVEAVETVERTTEDFIMRYHLLLDFIFCRSETYPIRLESIEPDLFLENFYQRWAVACEERGIELEVPAEPATTVVYADPEVLGRVIRWVVGNAIEYAKKNVQIAYSLDEKDFFIDITDDGPGFSERIRAVALEGFALGNTLHARNDIGLHLSLAKELLNLQGGDIAIKDPGPFSTTVRLAIPSVKRT
jgi:serine/threonine-protein kinase